MKNKILWSLMLLLVVFLIGCKTQSEPLREIHEKTIYRTDTIERTDSVFDCSTTIIREVDSTTMAQYGVTISNMQKAWPIQTNQLKREIDRLREQKTDSVIIRDTIPEIVVKEKELSQWQKAKMDYGGLAIALVVGLIVLLVFNHLRKL